MKKLIMLLSIIFAFSSCAKYSEQIDISKKKLLEWNTSNQELEKYKFSVTETFDKDIYNMIFDYYQKQSNSYEGNFEIQKHFLNKKEELLNKMETLKGDKIYYRVHAYRIVENDTLNDKTFFIDDKNNIIESVNRK